MDKCTDKPNFCAHKNKKEVKPLFINDSVYKYHSGGEKTCADRLTVWQSEKYNQCQDDKYDEIFDLNLNEINENVTSKDKYSKNGQCNCINVWKELRQVFELTDEELTQKHPIINTFPNDTFYNMQLDLNNDDCGDDLQDFELDGEYLYSQKDYGNPRKCNRILSDDYIHKQSNISDNEEEEEEDGDDNDDKKDKTVNKTQILKKKSYPTNNKTTIKNTSLTNLYQSIDKIIQKETGEPVSNANNYGGIPKYKHTQQQRKLIKKNSDLPKKIYQTVSSDNKKKEREYVYSYGEFYRGGTYFGHRNCLDTWIQVPSNKGWISEEYVAAQRQKLGDQKRERAKERLLAERRWRRGETTDPKDTIAMQKNEKPLAKAANADLSPGNGKRKNITTGKSVGDFVGGGFDDADKLVPTYRAGKKDGTLGARKGTMNSAPSVRFETGSPTAYGANPASAANKNPAASRSIAANRTNTTADIATTTPADDTEPMGMLRVEKTNNQYAIIMNPTDPNSGIEPVVFRLGPRESNEGSLSSTSSFEFELHKPEKPKKFFRDAQTMCTKEDFLSPAKKKTVAINPKR